MGFVHRIIGLICLIVGVILAPTPIPIGLPLLVIGLAFLAPYSDQVQRFIRFLRRKYQRLDALLLSWREKCPPVVRITIDKTAP